MEESFVPVARFLPLQEAYPLAGRLRADGIDARVVAQSESMYPYGPQGHGISIYAVIVPEREGARAAWILEHLRPSAPDGKLDDGGP